MPLLSLSRHLLAPLFRFLLLLQPPMDSRKSDPNPKPDVSPAAASDEEEEKQQEAVAAAEPEEAEEEDEGEFVEGEDDDDDDDDDEEEDEEEFEHVSEFAPPPRNPRAPFTSLSQVDADLALARTLQEQERAYMMLRMGGGGGSGGRDLAGSESGSEYELDYEDGGDADDQLGEDNSGDESDYDEDAFDAQDPAAGIDPSAFNGDEAYARALQDAEEREVAARLMAFAGINDWVAEDARDHANDAQDTWSEVDPDELSYEELIALGEAVGTESRGLTADTIASLPSVSYKAENSREGSSDQCVICRLDYEDGDSLIVLSCKHTYHPECINKWLQINKVCPICNAEVSTSESR